MRSCIFIDNCPATFDKKENHDIVDKTLGSEIVGTADTKCCGLCAKKSSCKAFFFDPEKGECIFKNANFPLTTETEAANKPGAYTGILNINSGSKIRFILAQFFIDTCPRTYIKIDNVEVVGHDIGSTEVGADAAKCCGLCLARENCKAYVYNADTGLCMFKSALKPTKKNYINKLYLGIPKDEGSGITEI